MIYKVINCIKISLVLFFSVLYTQNNNVESNSFNRGKELFSKNCTSCHVMGKQLIGPDLTKIVSRLQKEQGLDKKWLLKWIRDNNSLRKSGDKYANIVFQKFNKLEMPQFINLSNENINDILLYLENFDANANKNVSTLNNLKINNFNKLDSSFTTTYFNNSLYKNLFFISFLIIIVLLIWIALKLHTLVKITKYEYGISENDVNYIQYYFAFFKKNKNFLYCIYIILGLLSIYGFWFILFGIGVDRGYKPQQPIYFSHKIHSEINKIDCQLCHSSVKYSKVSGIPSLNTCMNCHRVISQYNGEYLETNKSRNFYNQEIKKIYEYVGWDEVTQSYSKPKKVIKWNRIHNMPDFVYFNHAQHVMIGGKTIIDSYNKNNLYDKTDVVCNVCHGKVDTMNVVEMANDFTMGWCIACHRRNQVDMKNGYNAIYFQKLHSKLKKNKNNKKNITVEFIGGLECGKCHY